MVHGIRQLLLKYSQHLVCCFLVFWLLLNLLQGLTTGLHPDEAYYWVYSKFLDWGYFDHPPLVAVFIKAGTLFVDNTMGLRMVGSVFNMLGVYFLWLIAKKYQSNFPLFAVLFFSVLIFHVYAFIITPDSPLFFFTVTFLLLYQRYLERDSLSLALLLGLVCACLLLSKYHGILVLFFILLSNLKLFYRKSFWLIMLVAVVAFLPHLYWQYENGFPTVQYHLFDRSASVYKFEYTAQYFLDQVLMMGPLVGWLLFYFAFKQKATDDFIKGLKYLVYGVLMFFFFSTFKGRVQAHWPLIEFIPLFILAYIQLSSSSASKAKVYKLRWLFAVNILLILIARLLLMSTPESFKKIKFLAAYNDFEIWAQDIQKVAADFPVVFLNRFQEPSYYNYYTNSLNSFGYNTIHYRKTQYDLWPIADQAIGRRVLVVTNDPLDQQLDYIKIPTVKGELYGTWIEDFQYYPKVDFVAEDFRSSWEPLEVRSITFTIVNNGPQDLDIQNPSESFSYYLHKDGRLIENLPLENNLSPVFLKPGESKSLSINFRAPEEAGKYKLFISIKTDPFIGTRNSNFLSLKVK